MNQSDFESFSFQKIRLSETSMENELNTKLKNIFFISFGGRFLDHVRLFFCKKGYQLYRLQDKVQLSSGPPGYLSNVGDTVMNIILKRTDDTNNSYFSSTTHVGPDLLDILCICIFTPKWLTIPSVL